MKALSAIATFGLALVLVACGADGSTTVTQGSEGGLARETTAAEESPATEEPPKGSSADRPIAGSPRPPKVPVPSGPAPKKLVVEDLKRGWGPAAKPQSRLVVHFIGVDYATGKPFETRWGPDQYFLFEYDHGLPMNGWERGLAGMRVGGRRKVIVPASLGYEHHPLLYVVELLAAEDRSRYQRPPGT
jgi:FKBP-type peptidyl-prolyl cis-trans isomerase